MIKIFTKVFFITSAFLTSILIVSPTYPSMIIDHICTDLSQIPDTWITTVKNSAKMYYGHTSHGEQLTVGLQRIEDANSFYSIARSYWNLPSESNTFNIYEPDIYNYWDYTASVPGILTTYPSINFSMYSWCMQLKEYTAQQVQDYLNSMAALEVTHPDITFIYMTGNAQDTGFDGYKRYLRNEQIRNYCTANDKVVYDFEDLDSWWFNPTTQQWEHATYDYNGYTIPVEHPHFYGSDAGHTTYESCEQKGKAVWWMMAKLAGWNPGTTTSTIDPNDVDGDGVIDEEDNCPSLPNSPTLGTCVNCSTGSIGPSCTDDGQCTSGYCCMDQNDIDNDGIGDLCDDSFPPGGNSCIDACDCEGNFDHDVDVDGTDVIKFKTDFGRKPPGNPCTAENPCNGDFDCDGSVDGSDTILFKQDFARRDCPTCAGGEWCGY